MRNLASIFVSVMNLTDMANEGVPPYHLVQRTSVTPAADVIQLPVVSNMGRRNMFYHIRNCFCSKFAVRAALTP